MQFADNASPDHPGQADQCLHCLLTESVGIVIRVYKQNRT